MRNIQKKAVCLILAVCLLSSLVCVKASVRSSDYLSNYQASLTAKSGGSISVTAIVAGRDSYSEIGVSKIIVYESADSGKTFSHYGTYYSDDYPAMMGSGQRYAKTALTFTGTVGNQYKVTAYCYAGDDSGSDTKTCYSNVVTAKK